MGLADRLQRIQRERERERVEEKLDGGDSYDLRRRGHTHTHTRTRTHNLTTKLPDHSLFI